MRLFNILPTTFLPTKTWVLRKFGNFRKILKLHVAYCLVFHKNENFVNTSTILIKIGLPVKINQNLCWTFTAVCYFTCNINFFLSNLFTIASEKRFFLITCPRPFELRMLWCLQFWGISHIFNQTLDQLSYKKGLKPVFLNIYFSNFLLRSYLALEDFKCSLAKIFKYLEVFIIKSIY